MASNALSSSSKEYAAEFDIREDEEQIAKQQDTIDLLLAAGYFRARIKTLSPFDKVVGGMVWCITLCNWSVDVDLFYSENSTIGQKIALTERVVDVLPQLKCPHSIEPHQIQGLDFIHIFPVVQWLVRKAVEQKERQGDAVRSHAVYQFSRNNRIPEEETSQKRREAIVDNYRQLKSMCPPRRVYRRAHGTVCADLREDVRCTLMEYGWLNVLPPVQGTSSAKEEDRENLSSKSVRAEAAEVVTRSPEHLLVGSTKPERQRLSARALVRIIDPSGVDEAAFNIQKTTATQKEYTNEETSRRLADAELELEALKAEDQQLDEQISHLERENERVLGETKQLETSLAAHRQVIETADKRYVEKLKELLEEHDELKKRESQFKADCKAELKKMDVQLQMLRRPQTSVENGQESRAVYEAELERARERLATARLADAELNRQVALAQRTLDSVPSQVEISQYQRRIIELCNQMAHKHREAKRFYTMHNTLIDVLAYRKRETDLMNSIDDLQQLASKEGYKESFIENLQRILKGVETSLDKVTTKQKELEATRDRLTDEYQFLLEKERLYYKTIDDFAYECQRNEELRKKLEEAGHVFDD